MSNFVGYIDPSLMTDDDKEWDLYHKLSDKDFKAEHNHILKVERSRMYQVYRYLMEGKQKEAEDLIRMIYEEYGLDPKNSDGDNFFCYKVGDKIRANCGLRPQVSYDAKEK